MVDESLGREAWTRRLRDRDDREALATEARGIAQRVVTTDGDERADAQRLEILEHQRGQVVPVVAGGQARGAPVVQPGRERGLAHGRWVGARGVQHRPTGPIDGPRADPIQGAEEAAAVVARRVDVGQPLPAAADAESLPADLAGAVDDALDDRIQARDVAAAGEDSDALDHVRSHAARSGGGL
jgi:hypothetical protein